MSEHDEQVALIQRCQWHEGQYPELRLLLAIPNGGARDAVTGARLKAEGVKKGVLDLQLPIPKGGFHSLWIEMKHGKNKPSADQLWWIEQLTRHGHCVKVCYSADEAFDEILKYLSLEG